MEVAVSLAELAQRAEAEFNDRFKRPPRHLVAAPGRVNIIGEHTDYNDGFVLPMAIDRYTVIAADKAAEPASRVYSAMFDESVTILVDGPLSGTTATWARYVRGVQDACARSGLVAPPFDAVIDSTVPVGGGLSSSAALEVATATLLEELTATRLDPTKKALLCQQAEHEGAGVPCGIMDQFSSVLCQAGHLMLLDCRSQQTQMVPLADPSVTVLIINSNVKHELTGGEYAERRSQCETAAQALGIASLRDATPADLEQHAGKMEPVKVKRARHVIGEIERTVRAAEAIAESRWDEVGTLMFASHASLRDDFEVSCPELDVLVAAAERLVGPEGVIGSRMTGGGFGGSTVSLVRSAEAARIADQVCRQYRAETGIEASAFVTPPAQGAHVLR